MRVGVVDIGTNSTRLLVADVANGAVRELDRRSQVTRLGDGVDASGRLGEAPVARVVATLSAYVEAMDAASVPADARIAVLTSAVRDAANGVAFAADVCERFGLDARILTGDEEARLTFLGATHDRDPSAPTPLLVFDIGGGSTELVLGPDADGNPTFHVSTQAGVVRQTERHIHHDPPEPRELQELAAEMRALVEAAVPAPIRASAADAVGVAGTPTSLAAIVQELEPYDPAKVHGARLDLSQCELLLARLAQMPLAERRRVRGLHPDRAATIVPGVVILIELLRAFELDRFEVSEHDLLYGAALDRARR
jgi:exopolyphosphatase/guanosine-5'-triphosphate,3'-diphosphate pyrophosphatase